MEAVNILLGEKTDWDAAKKVIVDAHFLDRLKDYDKDSISDAKLKRLDKIIQRPEYKPDTVGGQSKGTEELWFSYFVRAISDILFEQIPKQEPTNQKSL